ncbi:hypothetical protein B0H14DRAFT_2995704 [Mycena olivaceomarginata]|nr:hypothetical protein B0H14DRAFT_2995704 [Mycena olivaceomarginata]
MGQLISFLCTFVRVQLFANLPDTHADLTAAPTSSQEATPASIILAVRDLKKGETAKETIIAQTGYTGSLEVWELDMASFASVRRFAERANATLKRLDGAILNAESTLSTGLLGVLLLPLLQATTKLPHPLPDMALLPHLTITGSEGMFMAKFSEERASKILEAMNDKDRSCKDMLDRYFTSKLLEVFFTRKIAKLPDAQGVVVNIAAPGFCASELTRDFELSAIALYIMGLFVWSAAKGALNLMYGVLRPTPPGAYIYACEVQKVQAQIWSEMVEVVREVSPEVATIVASPKP